MKKIMMISLTLIIAAGLAADTDKQQRTRERRLLDSRMRSSHRSPCSANFWEMSELRARDLPEKIKLTETQLEQIKKLQYEHRMALVDLQASLKKLALQRRKYLTDADFQNAKKVTEQYYLKRAEIAKKRIELRESIYLLLNEEQRKIYNKLPLHKSN